MTVDEGQKVIEQFEAEGKSKEEIAGAFYLLFRDGKIDINGLEGLVNLLGYELDDEFKAMSPEDQKNYGYELADDQDDEEQEPNTTPEKSEDEEEAPKDEEEKQESEDNEKDDEKEGLGYFEGKAPKKEDEDDKDEEAEARKLLKY